MKAASHLEYMLRVKLEISLFDFCAAPIALKIQMVFSVTIRNWISQDDISKNLTKSNLS